ncbi:MAG TPA: hypothetical protein VF770_07275, partial [Solirubrobacterales bacterium]
MKGSSDDEGSRRSRATSCERCGAALARSQRYCLECGERCGPLPAPVAEGIDAMRRKDQRDTAAARGP